MLESLSNSLSGLAIMAIILAVGAIYFLPTLVGLARNHKSDISIAILNLFLGWTFIGWVITLAWAASGSNAQNNTEMKPS